MYSAGARYLNVLLGAWLFVSAFVWRHTAWEFTNTWIFGAITVVAALASFSVPGVRFVNTLVGVWLIVSGFSMRAMNVATKWNNSLLGFAILLVSLIGWRTTLTGGRRAPSSS